MFVFLAWFHKSYSGGFQPSSENVADLPDSFPGTISANVLVLSVTVCRGTPVASPISSSV